MGHCGSKPGWEGQEGERQMAEKGRHSSGEQTERGRRGEGRARGLFRGHVRPTAQQPRVQLAGGGAGLGRDQAKPGLPGGVAPEAAWAGGGTGVSQERVGRAGGARVSVGLRQP